MHRRAAAALAVVLLAACEVPLDQGRPVASVTVAPDSASILVGARQQFTATPKDSTGAALTGRVIAWASSDTTVAAVSANGLVTATGAGAATITATTEHKSGKGRVKVALVPVASLTVSPATANVTVGASVQLAATTKDSGGNVLTGRAITWTSSGPSVATVSGTGLVTGVGVGSITITALAEGKTGTATITVALAPVASVTVNPATANVSVGATAQLAAVTKDSVGNVLTGRAITWTSSSPSVATVSGTGLVTGVAVGSATITATAEGKTGTAVMTVVTVPVASVTVSPATANVTVGATVQLAATTKDSAGNVLAGRVVTWSSSSPTVATVSSAGLVTGVAAGSATITATSEGKSGTAAITVALAPVASVTISPATASIMVGAMVQLAATTKDSAGNVLTGRVVTWSSSSPTVATVSSAGLVTGVAAGSATITATSEGKSGTAAITVTLVPVASVTVSPATASVAVGATVQLAATTKDSVGNVLTGRAITWTSSGVTVATVSGTGLVTGVAAGSVTVTAASSGKAGTAAITVTTTTGSHAGWYASPSGTNAGNGSVAAPWDLQTALSGGNSSIQPGDTVWLRGGTYAGTFVSSLTGTATAPIVVRQYPGERATIDGGTTQNDVLTVDGAYAIYWGFEIMESGTQRFGLAGTGTGLRGDGVYVRNASNVKLINLIVHDTGHGTYTENAAHNIEIYGWIIYNGGNEDSTRSDGHGIYIKNDGIGWKIARDNVIFDQFGFGIHGYAQTGTNLINLILDGNVLFDNGTPSNFDNPNMQLGGTVVADNDTVTNNMVYFAPGVSSGNGNVRIGYSSTANGTAVAANNYIVGGTETFDVGYWTNLTVRGNTLVAPTFVLVQNDPASASTEHWTGNMHYHDPTAVAWQLGGTSYTFSNWQVQAGAADQASATQPATPRVFVRPNRYEAGRALIVIYNWSLQASVPVDLTGVVTVGKHYDVRNVQDIFGTPIVSGTYAGGTISIPMNGVTPPQPIGGAFQPLIKTGPAFDAFIVTSGP